MSETNLKEALVEVVPEDNTIKITPMGVLKRPPTIERKKTAEGARYTEYELDEGQSVLVHLFASQIGPSNKK